MLQDAILARKQVNLEYDATDGSSGVRTFSPHALYRAEDGSLRVDGIQTAGASSTPDDLPGWRHFRLSTISRAEPTDESFDLDAAYDPSSKAYRFGLLAGAS